jgi:hypothetical protein
MDEGGRLDRLQTIKIKRACLNVKLESTASVWVFVSIYLYFERHL